MKTDFRAIQILMLISLLGCVYDYGIIREKCTIPIQKEYIITFDKEVLFKKIQPGYTLSDSIEKNLLDSLFYFSIHNPKYNHDYLGVSIVLLCNINQMAPEKTKIRIKQLVEINGRCSKKALESNVKVLKSLTSNELIHFIELNFISHLMTLDSIRADISDTRIYYDNKELVDDYKNSFDN